MITRYRAALDGVQLDSLDDSIYIYDVIETPAKLSMKAAEKPGTDGTHITVVHRTSLQIEIQFVIRKRKPDERQSVMDKVASWSAGKVLTTSTRSGKRLRCMCVGLPAIDSALKWTETLSLTLAAYEIPYWESISGNHVIKNGVQEHSMTVYVEGSAPTILHAEVTNVGAVTINSITFSAGSSILVLSALGLKASETLLISEDDAGRLTINIRGSDGLRSRYSCLQPQSTDNLEIRPGSNTVRASAASSTVNIDLSYYPRWR